jgi:hypothetical protein
LPIANCRLPIGLVLVAISNVTNRQLAIGNRQ